MPVVPTEKPTRRREGLTLLELLLVVFILSIVAFSAVSLTHSLDEQSRYEDTKTRLENIRKAVIGRPSQSMNGQPVIDGFVADVGRLPNTLQELLEPGALPPWHYEPTTGLWAGWRGPYLPAKQESNGMLAYRDGWGNAGPAPHHGWKTFAILPQSGSLVVESFGADGTPGGADYAADYPPSNTLVEPHDYLVNLKGWSVTVEFVNSSDQDWPPADEVVRLRVYYPQDGDFAWMAAWPASDIERDATAYLSQKATLTAGEVKKGAKVEKVFLFGFEADKFIPWGIRSLAVVRDATGEPLESAGPPGGEALPRVRQNHPVTFLPRTQITPLKMSWKLE